jgi:hypothetical protein
LGNQKPARHHTRHQTGRHEGRRIVLPEAGDFSVQVPRRPMQKALGQIINHIHGLPDHAGRSAIAGAGHAPHRVPDVLHPAAQVTAPAIKRIMHQRRHRAASAGRLVPDPTDRGRQTVPHILDLAARGIRQNTPFVSHCHTSF